METNFIDNYQLNIRFNMTAIIEKNTYFYKGAAVPRSTEMCDRLKTTRYEFTISNITQVLKSPPIMSAPRAMKFFCIYNVQQFWVRDLLTNPGVRKWPRPFRHYR